MRRVGSRCRSLGRSARPSAGAHTLAPDTTPLHPCRSGKLACQRQRSGPRSRFHGADDGVVQPAAHQPRQPASVQACQRPLSALGASVADNYNGWVLPPLVICAVGAHKEILVKTESKFIRWLRCVKKSIETAGIRASGITRKTQVRGAMKRMKILATLLATIACALPAAAQYDETAKSFHLLPHLADGGGWRSVLLVTNTSQSASSCPEWPLPRSCGARQVAFISPKTFPTH